MFVEVFSTGQRVMMKARLYGIFKSKMQEPFLFIRYLDWHGRVSELLDNRGKEFSCAIYLIAVKSTQRARIYRRRNLRRLITCRRNLGALVEILSNALL